MKIYFDDMKPEAQKEFLDKLGTTPKKESWGIIPIAIYFAEEDDE